MGTYGSPGSWLAVASLLAAACAPSVRSERDAAIPVPHGATWAWASQGALPDTGRYIRREHAAAADPIVQQRVRRAIETVMETKGFRRVDPAAEPDFLLSYGFGTAEVGYARRPYVGSAAVSVGYFGGWGYWPSRFYPGWGFYRPWGFAPWGWGWGWYGAPVWAYAVEPAYPVGYHSYGGYGDGGLVVTLRLRSSGDVAFEGRARTSPYEMRSMSQEKMQELVSRMLKSLG